MKRKRTTEEQQDKLILVSDDIAEIFTAYEDAESIIAGGMAFPKIDLKAIPLRKGGKLYMLQSTTAAKVEAAQVLKLKRSAILAGLFSGTEEDRRGISANLTWLIIILALIVAIVLK